MRYFCNQNRKNPFKIWQKNTCNSDQLQYDYIDLCITHQWYCWELSLLKHPFKASENGFKEEAENEETTNQETDESVRDRNMVFEPKSSCTHISLVRPDSSRLPATKNWGLHPQVPAWALFHQKAQGYFFSSLYKCLLLRLTPQVTGVWAVSFKHISYEKQPISL